MSAYCEIPNWYDETFPRARKQHSCVECEAPILKGEVHLSYKGHWAGGIGFDSGRQHMLCREASMFVRDNFNMGECIGFGDLLETHREGRESANQLRERLEKISEPRRTEYKNDQLAYRAMMAKILRRQHGAVSTRV